MLFGIIGRFGAFAPAATVYGGAYTIINVVISLGQVVLIAVALFLMFRPTVNDCNR